MSTQLREILCTDFKDMLVLPSTIASCYYNYRADGSTSPGNYGYYLIYIWLPFTHNLLEAFESVHGLVRDWSLRMPRKYLYFHASHIFFAVFSLILTYECGVQWITHGWLLVLCASISWIIFESHEFCLHILQDGQDYYLVCILTGFIDSSLSKWSWKC
jgi:hypothetical protein